MSKRFARFAVGVTALALFAAPLFAATIEFKDPSGDDDGNGEYVYPTDAVYKAGSFDLAGMTVEARGSKVEFEVDVASKLDDPWRMETGFSVQMVFIFIDTDNKSGSGFTDGLPGLNVTFDAKDAWDYAIVLSPQTSARVRSEVESKVPADMQKGVVVPTRVRGQGRTISASVKLADLGGGDPATWGYQVVMQSNEGFPKGKDLLTRKVNEFEGQHRFGGGTDFDCDPHAIDILAGSGSGADSEIAAQHEMLQYGCEADGTSTKMAELKMVRK